MVPFSETENGKGIIWGIDKGLMSTILNVLIWVEIGVAEWYKILLEGVEVMLLFKDIRENEKGRRDSLLRSKYIDKALKEAKIIIRSYSGQKIKKGRVRQVCSPILWRPSVSRTGKSLTGINPWNFQEPWEG